MQKTATAVAHCKTGNGMVRVNGVPLELVQPETLRLKVFEPILILGKEYFAKLDVRIRVRGGGQTSQIYGTRARPRTSHSPAQPSARPWQSPSSPTTKSLSTRPPSSRSATRS